MNNREAFRNYLQNGVRIGESMEKTFKAGYQAGLASQRAELSSNPLQLDTDLAREYLVENLLPKFSDSTFSVYVRSALAGDFAYQLAMYLQSQTQQEPAIAVELESVASQIEDGYGLWMTCSGCHETEDGHSVGNYKFSSIFNCTLGSGCHECGGLGAVWETFGNESPAPEGGA